MENLYKENELIIFEDPNLEFQVDVIFKDETFWLSRKQIALLFDKERSVVSKHIKNILQTNELQADAVCAFFAHSAEDGKVYNTEFFNLDMILSVGYRVNSKRGTQFRIWANKVLKDHLLKGYSLNEKRLSVMENSLTKLRDSISLIERGMLTVASDNEEVKELIKVISDYSRDLKLLDDYDNQNLTKPPSSTGEVYHLTIQEVRTVLKELKSIHQEKLFGKEKDNSLDGSVNAIYQTFDGKDVYPSLSEKAANLLYLITKNHPFIDGNKRIAASVFLHFLNKNKALYTKTGEKLLSDGILAALTLLIAESKPVEKETMISIIMHHLNIK